MQRQNQKNQEVEESLQGPTMVLAIINFVFYIFTSIIGRSIISTELISIVLFGFSINNFLAGLYWTPFTSMIAHSGIPHLLGNLIFLFVYGFKLEEDGYNDKGIYFAYFITGFLSTILSAFLRDPSIISLGASGAVFGLLGVCVGIERRKKTGNYKSIFFAALILFIFSVSPNTNIFSHLFGLIIGIIIGNSNGFERFRD